MAMDPKTLFPYLQSQVGGLAYGLDPQGAGRWGAQNVDMGQAELARQEMARQEKEAKKKKRSGTLGKIAGTVGTIAGSMIPGIGPIVGPAIGGMVGEAAGQAAGGGGVDLSTVLQRGFTSGLSAGLAGPAAETMAGMPGMAGKVGGFMENLPGKVGDWLGGGQWAQGLGRGLQTTLMEPFVGQGMRGVGSMMQMPWLFGDGGKTVDPVAAAGTKRPWWQNPNVYDPRMAGLNAAMGYGGG